MKTSPFTDVDRNVTYNIIVPENDIEIAVVGRLIQYARLDAQTSNPEEMAKFSGYVCLDWKDGEVVVTLFQKEQSDK